MPLYLHLFSCLSSFMLTYHDKLIQHCKHIRNSLLIPFIPEFGKQTPSCSHNEKCGFSIAATQLTLEQVDIT